MTPSVHIVRRTASAALLIALAGSTHTLAAGPFGASLELTALDGDNGFVINNEGVYGFTGAAVSSAGDINGDGIADMIIGASQAHAHGVLSGESYVIFGTAGIGASGSLDLPALNGTNGFVIKGVDAFDQCGLAVSFAGDVNADGFDDVIIGAPWASANGQYSGQCYVVFGAADVGAGGTLELSALNGADGFVISGMNAFDRCGISVATAGDVNADGVDDLIIGKSIHELGSSIGESYVIYGAADIGAAGSVDLAALDGASGFTISGFGGNEQATSVGSSAGDINDDGVDDLIVATLFVSSQRVVERQLHVIFGAANIGADEAFDLSKLNGTNGFILNGVGAADQGGARATAAGDINGDGVDDLLIGANRASPNGLESGETYVVFGEAGIGAGGTFNLAALSGANGFVINGIDAGDQSGHAVSAAGDVNADGVDDLLIGAWEAGSNNSRQGESYIVFGSVNVGATGTFDLAALDGGNGVVITGGDGIFRSGFSVSSVGDVNIDGVDDVIIAAPGSEKSFVVFGKQCDLGDLDCDGAVGAHDLAQLLGNIGPCPPSPTSCNADLDADGSVGASDIAILIGSWSS